MDCIKVRPRAATDRGGYVCMPLKKNVPEGRPEWTLVHCPECGAECWRDPMCGQVEATGAKALCTMCALRKGAGKERTGYA